MLTFCRILSILLKVFRREYINLRPLGQAVKTPPFHGGITGSIPVGVISRCEMIVECYIVIVEDYPSPAEGIGLENRQMLNGMRGFKSLILLRKFNKYHKHYGLVAQLVEQRIEAPCVGGSTPS